MEERDRDTTPGTPHWGTTLDAFLEQEGIRDTATTEAISRVEAWLTTRRD